MNLIDAGQVALIRDYRGRLDLESQVAELDEFGERQPGVAQCANLAMASLGDDARWFGMNVLATIWRLFESAADDPVPPVPDGLLADRLAISRNQVSGLASAHRSIARRALEVRYARQPHVLAFAERMCLSHGSHADERQFDESELAVLFTMLGAATDALHEAAAMQGARGSSVRSLFG